MTNRVSILRLICTFFGLSDQILITQEYIFVIFHKKA